MDIRGIHIVTMVNNYFIGSVNNFLLNVCSYFTNSLVIYKYCIDEEVVVVISSRGRKCVNDEAFDIRGVNLLDVYVSYLEVFHFSSSHSRYREVTTCCSAYAIEESWRGQCNVHFFISTCVCVYDRDCISRFNRRMRVECLIGFLIDLCFWDFTLLEMRRMH